MEKKYLKLIKLINMLRPTLRVIDGEALANSDLPLGENAGFAIDTFMLDKSGNLLIVGER